MISMEVMQSWIGCECGGGNAAKPKGKIVIKKIVITRWSNISKAAKLLNRTPTQVARHVSGAAHSRKLAADMHRLGIEVAV